MIRIYLCLETIVSYWIIAISRIRVQFLKVRGAKIARKVSIGPQCVFNNPQCISLEERVKLEQGVYLKVVNNYAKLDIGAYSFLGKDVVIDCDHSIVIGKHVLLAPGVFVTDHNHGIAKDKRVNQQPCKSAPIIMQDDVWIGANSVILPGVRIGKGAVIGAGSVVTHDVETMSVVAGVPATEISKRIN